MNGSSDVSASGNSDVFVSNVNADGERRHEVLKESDSTPRRKHERAQKRRRRKSKADLSRFAASRAKETEKVRDSKLLNGRADIDGVRAESEAIQKVNGKPAPTSNIPWDVVLKGVSQAIEFVASKFISDPAKREMAVTIAKAVVVMGVVVATAAVAFESGMAVSGVIVASIALFGMLVNQTGIVHNMALTYEDYKTGHDVATSGTLQERKDEKALEGKMKRVFQTFLELLRLLSSSSSASGTGGGFAKYALS